VHVTAGSAQLGDLVDALPDDLGARLSGARETAVLDVTLDSRRVTPGALFACVPGARADGHDFAPAAVGAGARSLLVERDLPLAVAQVRVDDSRRAVGWLAAAFHGHPSAAMTVVGITGTNGKTTTAHLLGAVLRHAGRRTAVLGTLSGVFTTPEAPALQADLARLLGDGVEAVVMEASSHALALQRVTGTRFALAAFTNLGRDHLDFHETPERYFAAKSRLFTPELSARGVVWIDDPHGRLLADAATIPIAEVGMVDAGDVRVDARGSHWKWRGVDVDLPIIGRHNVANALVAAAAAEALGLEATTVAAGLSSAPPVPGRLEPVDAGQPFAVFVDFAHTPEALATVLDNLRELTASRLIVVFGCGGDRDPAKRPLMGSAAAARADIVVVTSDNPRHDDPEEIIDAVVAGVPARAGGEVRRDPDRRAAIGSALGLARAGDVVVIAGKGHETTQTVAGEVRPFDDRAVARELLEAQR
jgi:UDP-N-acetylmuramoyl-L-alanyl-D-glutamate--2,6-diaminopimelate ligase